MSRGQHSTGGRRSEEQVREVIATILAQEISDPRVEFVTVTNVLLNADRTVASVYVSTDKGQYENALAGLESAKGRIRSLLGHSVEWRQTPEIRFFIDDAIDEAERIDQAIRQAHND